MNLPEKTAVEVTLPTPTADDAKLDAVYQVLSERYHSGRKDLSERRNEHQP